MTVLYVARKKVDKSGDTPKVLYYATPQSLQNKSISERVLADQLAEDSSLTSGDVLSTLNQLPKKIAEHLKDGRTITIHGLGTFYLSLTSKGVETPKECRPTTLHKCRICFRPAKEMRRMMGDCEFELIE